MSKRGWLLASWVCFGLAVMDSTGRPDPYVYFWVGLAVFNLAVSSIIGVIEGQSGTTVSVQWCVEEGRPNA